MFGTEFVTKLVVYIKISTIYLKLLLQRMSIKYFYIFKNLPELNPNIRSVYIVSSRKSGSLKSPECFFVTQKICSDTKRDEPDSKNVKGK